MEYNGQNIELLNICISICILWILFNSAVLKGISNYEGGKK